MFSGQTTAAILFEADTHWPEGPLARQVIVRNSIIEDVDRVKRAKGDITVDTSLERVAGRSPEAAGGYLSGDIEISGNTFRNSCTAAVALGFGAECPDRTQQLRKHGWLRNQCSFGEGGIDCWE